MTKQDFENILKIGELIGVEVKDIRISIMPARFADANRAKGFYRFQTRKGH